MKGKLKRATLLAIGSSLVIGFLLIFSGCSTAPSVPNGYDADTTPSHNGEAWVGGK